MEEAYSYYKENIDAYTRRLGNLKKKIHLMGSIRLALVAGAILSLWIFRDESWQWLTGITFVYIIPFALLMWYHNRMYARKVYAETLIKLNEDELKGLDYNFSAFDGADLGRTLFLLGSGCVWRPLLVSIAQSYRNRVRAGATGRLVLESPDG